MSTAHSSGRDPRPQLSLYDPDTPGAHGIPDAVRTPPPSRAGLVQTSLFVAEDLRACYEQLAAEHAESLPVVPEADRPRVRGTLTLPDFYREWMAPWREEQRRAGRVKGSTLQKNRQAIARYERWDSSPERRPAQWPPAVAWTGLPIGYITGPWLDRFLQDLASRVSASTAETTWYHLRTVINFAVKVKALDDPPRPQQTRPAGDDEDEDLFARSYTAEELSAVYRALSDQPDLQAALVLGANAGPRPSDLFLLRWKRNVRVDGRQPEMFYRAIKTGKKHWAPLGPCTVAHLRRLRERQLVGDAEDALVFPGRSSAGSVDPEKSRPARRRTTLFKRRLAAAGVGVPEKPWQVLRSTCNTRYKEIGSDAGKVMMHGPDADVNSQFYDEARPRTIKAVAEVPQPEAFLEILGG